MKEVLTERQKDVSTLIAIDVGGTKVAGACINMDGELIVRSSFSVRGLAGDEVGDGIYKLIQDLQGQCEQKGRTVQAIGVGVPGIYRRDSGTVWAPNIEGWEDYPLLERISSSVDGGVKVVIDSDRSCYIAGEVWQGAAMGMSDAIYVAVGTGIGAGIMVDGRVIKGAHDIAGSIGWMALSEYKPLYSKFGCFEYHASGSGIERLFNSMEREGNQEFTSDFKTAQDIFKLYDDGDANSVELIDQAISYWGKAVANLVSIFDPQIIVLGGGMFGAAERFIPRIREEATKWAQPISMPLVKLVRSELGSDACLFGAAYLSIQSS